VNVAGPVAGAFNESFFGLTTGMVVKPDDGTRLFESEIGGKDLRLREIWIRAAEVVAEQGILPSGATGFRLGLKDAHGRAAYVDVNLVGGLPRPYRRPEWMKSMLSTIRFKAHCFLVDNPELDLSDVRTILIECDRSDGRAIAFDDLQIVMPPLKRIQQPIDWPFALIATQEETTGKDRESVSKAPKRHFTLPKVLDIKIRATKFEAPRHRHFVSSLRSGDAVEFIVTTDGPIPGRAVGPALYVGDVIVTEVTTVGPNTYRFVTLALKRLKTNAPIVLSWTGQRPRDSKDAAFRYTL
jgi:hypothetical protein